MLSVVVLSAAGIYAMMSFTVARRRREIGIRAALGADRNRLLAGRGAKRAFNARDHGWSRKCSRTISASGPAPVESKAADAEDVAGPSETADVLALRRRV